MKEWPDRIPLLNIYYMMAYAWEAVDLVEFRDVAAERFTNAADLMAAILVQGISTQLGRGLYREYEPRTETLDTIRGKVDVWRTKTPPASLSGRAICTYEEFTEDTELNRILKATCLRLAASPAVNPSRQRQLRNLLVPLSSVSDLDPRQIRWKSLTFHRDNRFYCFLMGVCYMALNDMVLSSTDGPVPAGSFRDSQAPNQLYERFLLNYFRRHHPGLHPSSAEVGASRADLPDFVPALLTDVTLSNGSQTLIVDAKCYGHVFSSHYEHRIVAPANINQIFHYVLAAADERPGQRVSGMLLYAKTADEDIESGAWVEHGHSFEVKLLDLNQRFDRIAADLDEIAETYLTSNR